MADGSGPEGDMMENVFVPRLVPLASHHDRFQAENFFKALQRGGNKFSRLFSPLRAGRTGNGGSAQEFTVDEMLIYSPEPIPTSLLKLSNDYASRAVKMFSGILKYIGTASEYVTDKQKVEIAQKLLHQGLKRPELKDELYMQLLKQTRGNPNLETNLKSWELFHLVTATMPPNKDFVDLVSEYIHQASHGDSEQDLVREAALRAWVALKRSAKAGARRTLPSVDEIEALLGDHKLTCIVFFLDETFEELSYDITSTVLEAVEQLAGVVKLQNYSTFTLFECRKAVGARTGGESTSDEHLLIDDNRYIADVLFEFKNPKSNKDGVQSKLLLKKRMFRETDETITEPQFVNLCYVQAQYDYLLGNYPVVKEDAAQLCALQMQADHGPSLVDSEEEVAVSIEKFIPKQALVTRARDEWRQDVMSRYRPLEQFSKEDARLQFLRILRSLPYGNSIFFPVRRIEDPIGLLPSKLILGINKRGVHFFRPVPKEYLHSAELRDIMQFGSSSQAVFFKMRVAGVLHIFQFETRQGEDICLALQTHINDIMMKRYSKAKAMQATENKQDTGPKYEKHANQMQKLLEEKNKMIEDLQKREEELRHERDKVAEELEEEFEKLRAEEEAKLEIIETKEGLEQKLEELKEQIAAAREALGDAEKVKAAAVDAAKEAVDGEKVEELENAIQTTSEQLKELSEKAQSLEKQYKQAAKEKDLMEKKMQRLEKSREMETTELREKLSVAQANVGAQLRDKDAKVNELMEELSKTTALYNANKLELEQIRTDLNELEDLREMKADVERKEKQQQVIIANQAKRLDELETLHKDEQMLRKKYLSQMEDMQGKIRVYVRLGAGGSGQPSVQAVDEYTIVHGETASLSGDEYAFDQVFPVKTPNQEIMGVFKPYVKLAVDGFNAAVVSYGIAGSGKTHSLYGSGSDNGLITHAGNELFNLARKKLKKFQFTIKCNMVEVYDETLTDLLTKDPKDLLIKKDCKGVVKIFGATEMEVKNAAELGNVLKMGMEKVHSSGHDPALSNVAFSLIVHTLNMETGSLAKGRLSFFDLAGCDRPNVLNSIHDVLEALENERPTIPYTATLLSMLMSDTFGGNSKTAVLVHISPEESVWEPTEQSLRNGLLMRSIKNSTNKNEANKDILKLRKTLDSWKEQAGLPKHLLEAVDFVDVADSKDTAE